MLYHESELQPHAPDTKKSDVKKFKTRPAKELVHQECSSYFIEMKEWMNIPEDETQHGKIMCPNQPKCN